MFVTFSLNFERATFIGPTAIVLEHWGLPYWSTSLDLKLQNRYKWTPQQPTFSVYIRESWTLGKPYQIKLRCYWECITEQLGNLRNLKETMLGTHWEQGRPKKKDSTPKRKNQCPSWVYAGTSHWLNEISVFKTVCHCVSPGLMARAEIWGHSTYSTGVLILFHIN